MTDRESPKHHQPTVEGAWHRGVHVSQSEIDTATRDRQGLWAGEDFPVVFCPNVHSTQLFIVA